MATIHIVSFAFGHGDAPHAHVVLDLRPFHDPHVDPQMRQMTGRDRKARRAVLRTPGIRHLLKSTTRQVAAYTTSPATDRIVIAPGCTGDRYQSYFFAEKLARRLRRRGHTVTVAHRGIHQPVTDR
jgi:RNase adaptor protein for sRNA GlmZ degradation